MFVVILRSDHTRFYSFIPKAVLAFAILGNISASRLPILYTEHASKIDKTFHDIKSITFHRDVGLNINLADWWSVRDLGLFQVNG